MTIEEVLECSASELEALSSDDLKERLKHYFPLTRPEQVAVNRPTTSFIQQELDPKRLKMLKIMADAGVDLDIIKRTAKTKK